jgi:hypothetical protein
MKNVIIVLSFFSLLSCKNRNSDFIENELPNSLARKERVEHVSLIGDDNANNFQTFWSEFRDAVLAPDSIQLMKMVKFPLSAHGNQDADPQLQINEKDFAYIFHQFLNRKTVFYNEEYERNIDEIHRLKEVNFNPDTGTESWRRVGDMQFEKGANGWQLVQIYIDTNELNIPE